MPLKRKIVIGLFFVLSISIMLNLLIYDLILKPSYEHLEQQYISERAELIRLAIAQELERLSIITVDWGHWHDMYEFVEKGNEDFVRRNLAYTTFKSYPFNLVYILNRNNAVVFARAYDLTTGRETVYNNFTPDVVAERYPLDRVDSLAEGITEIVRVNKNQAMLVTLTDIRKSDDSADVRGVLVMGRLVDQQLLDRLGNILGLTLQFADPQEIDPLLSPAIHDSSQRFITDTSGKDPATEIFVNFFDNRGDSVFWLRTEYPGELTVLGHRAHEINIIASLLIIAVMTLFLFVLFQRHLFAPVTELTEKINLLKNSKDLTARLDFNRSDELGVVAREFDALLEKLQDSHNKLLTDFMCARNLSQQLNYHASHDSLTDLVNRREFEHRLQRVIDEGGSTEHGHVIFYMDLDQFKLVNDTCGHEAGDEMLKSISRRLKTSVRRRDTLARIGGDEFAILMEHCPIDNAVRVVDSIIQSLNNLSFQWQGHSFTTGISIGLYHLKTSDQAVNVVMKRADSACYIAKNQGRNCYHIYKPDDENRLLENREVEWTMRINRAFDENRLLLATQSITPINDFGNSGHFNEFLLRVQEENGDILDPQEYLGGMSRYGLNKRLDRYVVDRLCNIVESDNSYFTGVFICSINISADSIRDINFVRYAIDRLDTAGIPAEKVCFEVTETTAIANLNDTLTFMQELKKQGFYIALDDFGSGLSSFAYLRTLPVDFVKIDGIFIRDIVNDPVSLSMVRSMNDIAKIMGKQTIAESVENEATYRKLAELGVDYVQGKYIDSPSLVRTGSAEKTGV